MPVLVGGKAPLVAVLDRHIRAGAVGKIAAVRRAFPEDRDIQQTREVDIGRGEHDAHLIGADCLDRGDLGQAVVVGRGLVQLRGLQAGDHVVRGQRLARPEGHIPAQGEGEGRAVALIALAQHVFRGEVVRHLEQALVQRLAQHAVDARAVEHRVERAVLVPGKAEVGVRHLDVVDRFLLAVLAARKATGAQQAERREERCEHTFFPFHKRKLLFVYRQIMPPCTPRRPFVLRCDQNSSLWHMVQMPLSITFSGERPASSSSLTPMPCRSTWNFGPFS